MKILLIAGLAESLVNFRGHLIAALQAVGMEVHVAAPELRRGSPLREQLEVSGCQVHNILLCRAGTNPVADLRTLLCLWRLMRRIRPTHVLGYTIKPVIYGSLAAHWAGVPNRFALITGLGYTFTGQPGLSNGGRDWLRAVAQRLYAHALYRVDKVFFQNPDDMTLFRDLGILSSKVPVVVVNGSGVDVENFDVTPIPVWPPHFLLIARLLGDKGVREYAEAAQRIKAAHSEVLFSLVGWIDENPDAIGQEELESWIADGRLDFLGRMSDVRQAIEACTVYVLPSYREGTPRTVLEAMAMGRPIITTDVPGCRETVVDGDNGFLVPMKSVDALVQAMEHFIEARSLVASMGVRSRQVAEEKYDVHKVNEVMLREMGL